VAKNPGKPKANGPQRDVGSSSQQGKTEPTHRKSGPIGTGDLLAAARDGDIEGIRAALDAGISIDAMAGGMADTLKQVLPAAQKMADAMKSMKGGEMEKLIALAAAANMSARSEQPRRDAGDDIPHNLGGMTALMIAAKNGRLETARFLIERGADLMARSSSPPMGQPPLYFATWYKHIEVMKLLLDAGADPSSTGKVGSGVPIATPLFAAVDTGQPDAVRLLLERGARTDLKSSDIAGVMTPLELAIRYNRTEIAEILKQVSEK
jgi:hypothetical protein